MESDEVVPVVVGENEDDVAPLHSLLSRSRVGGHARDDCCGGDCDRVAKLHEIALAGLEANGLVPRKCRHASPRVKAADRVLAPQAVPRRMCRTLTARST